MFARLRKDIEAVFTRDPAAESCLEIMAAYPVNIVVMQIPVVFRVEWLTRVEIVKKQR